MRSPQVILAWIAVGLGAATIWLPLWGAIGVFEAFEVPFRQSVFVELLSQQLPGPLVAFLVALAVLLLARRDMLIPRWLALIGALASIYASTSAGEIGHDFSHVLFDECTGYGRLIFWITAALSLLLATIYALDVSHRLGPFPAGPQLKSTCADWPAFLPIPDIATLLKKIPIGLLLAGGWVAGSFGLGSVAFAITGFALRKAFLPYNEEGNYFDGEMVHHAGTWPIYLLITIPFWLLSLAGLVKALRLIRRALRTSVT